MWGITSVKNLSQVFWKLISTYFDVYASFLKWRVKYFVSLHILQITYLETWNKRLLFLSHVLVLYNLLKPYSDQKSYEVRSSFLSEWIYYSHKLRECSHVQISLLYIHLKYFRRRKPWITSTGTERELEKWGLGRPEELQNPHTSSCTAADEETFYHTPKPRCMRKKEAGKGQACVLPGALVLCSLWLFSV